MEPSAVSTANVGCPEQKKGPQDGVEGAAWTHEMEKNDQLELNPQGGSPMHTFTATELDELRSSLPSNDGNAVAPTFRRSTGRVDILSPGWASSDPRNRSSSLAMSGPSWHGAPILDCPNVATPRKFRQQVRAGGFVGPTNGQCPGFLQCNLVVLRQGQQAFDFLLFCQRNKKACPLVEVCELGSPHPKGIARGADLRTDVPKYAIYRDGALEKEVTDVTDYWPDDSVAFLIGCSFSYEGALTAAGIPLRSVEQKKNVPMYRTNLECRPAGSLKGNMVVSMKPIKAINVAKEVEITSKYPHAHGAPVCVGCPGSIGIQDVNKPDWGDAVEIAADELPVFHACGVTPQNILMESKVPFAITHSAGYMFVSDLPADTVI